MKFLENPGRRRRKHARKNPRRSARRAHTKRRPPAGWSSWKAYMASIRKKRKGSTTHSARRNPVASKKRHRKGGARRHRGFSRNPPILRQAIQGVQDSAFVLIGDAGADIVPNLLNLPKAGVVGIAARSAAVIGLGFLAHRFLGADRARFVVAGGLASIGRGVIVGLNVPIISAALSSYPMGRYANAMGALPPEREGPLMLGESYFADMGMTEEEYQGAA